jgi:Domain of unknown function (DUF4129)
LRHVLCVGTLGILLICAFPTLGAPACAFTAPCGAVAQSTPDPMQLRRDILADRDLQQREAAVQPPQLPDLPNIDLSLLKYVIAGLGAVVLVILLALLVPMLIRFFVRSRLRHKTGAGAGDGAGVATSVAAIQRAQEASAGQEYRLALRMLYLAALLKLDEVGALNYDRALTNREYVRQVALKPALAVALSPVVDVFDETWYGFRPVTADGYRAFESRVNALMIVAEESRMESAGG